MGVETKNLEGTPLTGQDIQQLKFINCPFDPTKVITATHDLRLVPKIAINKTPLDVIIEILARKWYKDGIFFFYQVRYRI